MKRSITAKCALCGQPVQIQPDRIAELPDQTNLNFYCLVCGVQVAEALEKADQGDRIQLHHP